MSSSNLDSNSIYEGKSIDDRIEISDEVEISWYATVEKFLKELDDRKEFSSNASEYNDLSIEDSDDTNIVTNKDDDIDMKALGNNRCSIMLVLNIFKDEVPMKF